jgi:hypothetical protein
MSCDANMAQSIMKAASTPESLYKGKMQSENFMSYVTSRTVGAAVTVGALVVGGGAVLLAASKATSSSNVVDSAKTTIGEWV